MWNTNVRSGLFLSFEEYWNATLENYDQLDFLNPVKAVRRIAQVFGTEILSLISYDELLRREEDICTPLLEKLDILGFDINPAKANLSVQPHNIQIVRQLNRKFHESAPYQTRYRGITQRFTDLMHQRRPMIIEELQTCYRHIAAHQKPFILDGRAPQLIKCDAILREEFAHCFYADHQVSILPEEATISIPSVNEAALGTEEEFQDAIDSMYQTLSHGVELLTPPGTLGNSNDNGSIFAMGLIEKPNK